MISVIGSDVATWHPLRPSYEIGSQRLQAPIPGRLMRFLLTSAGIKNASIRDALVDLLGKPIAESSALCIPTAMYGHPMAGPGAGAWRFITGRSAEPLRRERDPRSRQQRQRLCGRLELPRRV